MGIRRNHWVARVSILALLVAVCTVPQTRTSEAINRCQTIETITFSSYSGTVGGAQIALKNYENCLIQQYGSTKASLVPCAAYLKIASAFFVLSSLSRYLTKALADYTWCVTGEKSIYESKTLTSCDAYLDVVRIAVSAGDISLASFATNASSDCQTRTLLSTTTPPPASTPTPSKNPTPSPSPTQPALLEMPPPPLPSVNGEVQIGKTITLVWSTPISGYDSVTYKWLQVCNASNNCRGSTEILGANQSSYTIQSKDAGFGISVNILFKKVGFKDYERSVQVTSIVSALTQSPTPKPAQILNISAPSSAVVSGNPIVGGTLIIRYSGAWMNEVNLSYQWMRRCILIACPWKTNTIAGATSSTYSPTIQDKGQQIYVVITAKKEGYFNKSIESAWPGPAILGAPDISGILQEGRTLIGYEGSWESGYTFTYRWEVTCQNASPPLNSCYRVIPSASSKTFKITSSQTGKAIRFIVIGTKRGSEKIESYSRDYGEIVNYSHKTPRFLPVPQQPTPTPKPSVITQPSFVPPPTTSGVDCNSNPSPLCGGSVAPSSPSTIPAPTPIVTPSTIPAPTPAPTQQLSLAPTPAISGLGRPGDILRVSPGAWDAGVKLTYQWLRSGVSTGISSLTYTVSDADVNQNITVRVTGTKAGFTSVSRESSSILVTPLRVLTLTPSPIISCGRANGQCYVGDLAKVVPGKWDSGVTLSFRWLRIAPPKVGRTLIGTGTTYKITESDAGKGNLTQIVVEVTGSLTGFQTVTVLAGTYPFRR